MRALLLALLLPALASAQALLPASSSGTVTARAVEQQILGEDLSCRSLVLPGLGNATSDTLTLLSGRLRLAPQTVNNGAVFYWDNSIGFVIGNQLNLAVGAALLADYVESRTSSQPLQLSATHGYRAIPRSAVGTCGSSAEPEGTQITLLATSTSRTRHCLCTSDGAGTPAYAWENNRGDVGTASVCPEVTP